MNLLTKTTDLAMYLCLSYIKEGDIVIDATCGNGNDTLALSEAVGQDGTVMAFDIQNQAIETTRALMQHHGKDNCLLILDSFVNMGKYVDAEEGRPSACIFNLGYLPNGDKGITTDIDSSMLGVKAALELIKPGGVVVITMYQGHEAGKIEKEELLKFAGDLPKSIYHCVYLNMINQSNNPPEILAITKKK